MECLSGFSSFSIPADGENNTTSVEVCINGEGQVMTPDGLVSLEQYLIKDASGNVNVPGKNNQTENWLDVLKQAIKSLPSAVDAFKGNTRDTVINQYGTPPSSSDDDSKSKTVMMVLGGVLGLFGLGALIMFFNKKKS